MRTFKTGKIPQDLLPLINRLTNWQRNQWLGPAIRLTDRAFEFPATEEAATAGAFTPQWPVMSVRMLTGDCREVLPTLAAASVQCVCTSPPYFGLRDYGTATWDGGDQACDHLRPAAHGYDPHATSTLGPKRDGCALDNSAHSDPVKRQQFRDICGKCGARRTDAQLGLEATPDEYVAALVAVFREVRRVLRDDGTVWLNLGDSYANDTKWGGSSGGKHVAALHGNTGIGHLKVQTGAKAKDLLMIPARVALALQADGWWLRSDIIWAKPNPMPESVTDRPTSAHEHVFLLTKSAQYFFDADAVRETATTSAEEWETKSSNWRNGNAKQQQRGSTYHPYKDAKPFENGPNPLGRNIRNVWTIATQPYAGAHFATMPPSLVERCIKAGTSERGCCAACGAPWVRQVERSVALTSGSGKAGNPPKGKHVGGVQTESGEYDIRMGPSVSPTTVGWLPSCQCAADVAPCTVLDPFAGAGTTAIVADPLGRNAICIGLNPAYGNMATDRLLGDAGLFAEVLS